jgi:predicted nucleic acid-binding protein
MYLLDTNVLSARRRPDRAPQIVKWLASRSEDELYLSVATIGEVESGIVRQERINPPFATDLRNWLERTVDSFGDRILPFGQAEARVWGQLSARLGNARTDLIIAATALNADATLVTVDGGFAGTGVRLINPLAG